jgi:hypothetical protein
LQCDIGIVRPQQGAHDVEPHTGAAAITPRREKGLKDTIAIAFGNALAIVADRKGSAFAASGRGKSDPRRATLCRIISQMGKYNGECLRRSGMMMSSPSTMRLRLAAWEMHTLGCMEGLPTGWHRTDSLDRMRR